jgi:hypothetical protein
MSSWLAKKIDTRDWGTVSEQLPVYHCRMDDNWELMQPAAEVLQNVKASHTAAILMRERCALTMRTTRANLEKALRPGALGQIPHDHYEHLWDQIS